MNSNKPIKNFEVIHIFFFVNPLAFTLTRISFKRVNKIFPYILITDYLA